MSCLYKHQNDDPPRVPIPSIHIQPQTISFSTSCVQFSAIYQHTGQLIIKFTNPEWWNLSSQSGGGFFSPISHVYSVLASSPIYIYRSVPSTSNAINYKSSPYIEPCIPRTFFFSLRSRICPSKPIHPHGNQSQTSRCWIHFSVENNEKRKMYPRGRIKLLSFFLVDTFHFPRLLAWWGACKEEVSHQSSLVASRSDYYCVCYQFFFRFPSGYLTKITYKEPRQFEFVNVRVCKKKVG